jgi:predicted phage tail protein
MDRKVYLVGEIEKKFGSEFFMHATSYSDIIKCIDCNRPGFKHYLIDCHEKGINFTIKSAGKDIEDEDLFTTLKEGDVTIAVVPAGSKSDGMKIVSAIALIVLSIAIPGSTVGVGGVEKLNMGMKIMNAAKSLSMAMGVNLALQGIQGMLAPDPATDAEEDAGYLYTGGTNLIIEGDPVPLLYGELRVAGQPISIGVETYNSGAGGSTDNLQYSTVGGIYGDAGATEVPEFGSFNGPEDYWES